MKTFVQNSSDNEELNNWLGTVFGGEGEELRDVWFFRSVATHFAHVVDNGSGRGASDLDFYETGELLGWIDEDADFVMYAKKTAELTRESVLAKLQELCK